MTARDKGKFTEAAELVQRARQHYQDLGDNFSLAQASVLLARLLSFSGRFDEVTNHLNEALPIYQEYGSTHQIAYFTVAKGLNWLMLGRYNKSRTEVQRGLQLSYELQDQITICFGMSILGTISIGSGDYPKAEQLLNQAIVLSRAIGRPEELGTVLACLGFIKLHAGEIQLASRHALDGVKLIENSGNFIAIMFTAPVIALLLRTAGHRERSDILFALCRQFPFFRRSVFLQSLYGKYLPAADPSLELTTGLNEVLTNIAEASTIILRQR